MLSSSSSFYGFSFPALLVLAVPVCIALFSPSLTLAQSNFAPDSSETAAATTTRKECSFTWEVRARGIALGITQDTVSWDNHSAKVVSLFTPSAIASILGAPTVERMWSSSKSQGIVREENKYTRTDAPHNVRWAVKGTKMWKTVNKQPREESPTPTDAPGQRYIDSSVFPYLDLVGQPINAAPTHAWVLNQGDPYQATLQRTTETAEYSTSTSTRRGTVWVSAGKPTKLSFSEGSDKFESTVVSSKCK